MIPEFNFKMTAISVYCLMLFANLLIKSKTGIIKRRFKIKIVNSREKVLKGR